MSDKGYVYEMYETEDWRDSAPIYIGKTKNIRARVNGHFSILNNGKMTKEEYEKVKCIRVAEFPTYADAGIVERYLIGIKQPRNNTQLLKEGIPTVSVGLSEEAFFEIDMNKVSIKERKPRISTKRSKLLKLLENCYLIAHNGRYHCLHYPRSHKFIYFTHEYYRNEDERNDEKLFLALHDDIIVFSGEIMNDFFSISRHLGVPETTVDALGYGCENLSSLLHKTIELENKYHDEEISETKANVVKYMERYKGIAFEPYYCVRRPFYLDKDFMTQQEAEDFVDAFCRENMNHNEHGREEKAQIYKISTTETELVSEREYVTRPL